MRFDSIGLDAEQLLGIRQFDGLEDIEIRQAARLLTEMTECSLRAGTRLSERGAALTEAWFVIEGALRVSNGTYDRRVGAHEMVGLLEVLAGAPDGLDVTCLTDCVVLEIRETNMLALLEDDFQSLVGTMRSLSAAILQLSPLEQSPNRAQPPEGTKPLGFVERLAFLFELSRFDNAGAESTAELALAMVEALLEGVVAGAGETLGRLLVVVRGELHYGGANVSAGSAFGALHGVAEVPLAHDLVAEPGTTVLSCSVETMIDMLEDDQELALGWVRGLAARLVQLTANGESLG